MKAILVFLAIVATALVFSSVAFANSLTCAHGASCQAGEPFTPPSASASGHSGGTLPFTGIDLAGVAGVAGLLLVSGLTLHRVSRRRS